MNSPGAMREQDSHDHDDHHDHPIPIVRFIRLLIRERADLWVLVVYTVVAGLFALAVPLATQTLVNIIAAGVLLQPLVVLTLLVLVGMLCSGFLQLLRLALVERLQQRVFARVALEIAERMVHVRTAALRGEYAPELVNRFFDVLTLQKTLAKILVDGLAAALQALVGLVLLATYNPLLLGFDVFVILFIAFIIAILGWNGLTSSVDESEEKYRVADWLEELARCHTSLKMHGDRRYLLGRADNAVVRYIVARREHFKVFWRQSAGSYVFQALASAGVLAIGGFLVINRQLTLGQLVAAQIIIVSVLSSLEKLVRQAEDLFDLLTSMEKVGHVTDLPMERAGGHAVLEPAEEGLSVVCRGIRFAYRAGDEIIADLNLSLEAGDRVSLVGASGAGKSTLAAIICGLEDASHGTVEIDGIEVRSMNLASLRRVVTLVGYTNEIFDGTIEDNIRVGRDYLSPQDVRWALEMAQLTDDIARFPEGLNTVLVSAGQNLSRGQAQRLLIARALVGRPRLLVLDEAFTGIDERTTMKILDGIYASENRWTIIDISHEAEVVMRSATIHVLADGRITESGTAEDLAKKEKGAFAALFPYLCSQLTKPEPSEPPAPRTVRRVKKIKKVSPSHAV